MPLMEVAEFDRRPDSRRARRDEWGIVQRLWPAALCQAFRVCAY